MMVINDNLSLSLLYNSLKNIKERGGQALWREHLEFPASETVVNWGLLLFPLTFFLQPIIFQL